MDFGDQRRRAPATNPGGCHATNVQSVAGELQNAGMNKDSDATRAQLPAIMDWFSRYTPAPSIIAMNGSY